MESLQIDISSFPETFYRGGPYLSVIIGVVLVTTFVAKHCLGAAYGVYFGIALMLLHDCLLENELLFCRVWNIVFSFETTFYFHPMVHF